MPKVNVFSHKSYINNYLVTKLLRVQLSLQKLTKDMPQGDVGFLDPGRGVGIHGKYEISTFGKFTPAAGHTYCGNTNFLGGFNGLDHIR